MAVPTEGRSRAGCSGATRCTAPSSSAGLAPGGRHPALQPADRPPWTIHSLNDGPDHRQRRPDRLGGRTLLRSALRTRDRRRQQHARPSSSASTATPPGSARTSRRAAAATATSTSTSATGRGCMSSDRARLDPTLIIHCAAQPSHDLAAQIPFDDFEINALGTLNLLEATRRHAPEARLRLHEHQQGLRRRARTASPLEELEHPLGLRRPRLCRRHRRDHDASTSRCTACSARARSRPTCWCRSTAATSA